MKFNLTHFVYFLCLFIFYRIKCDLPVHCLKHEIVGHWIIEATDLFEVSSGHKMRCGHSEPSSEDTSYKAKSPYEFKHKYKLDLTDKNEAHIDIDGKPYNGLWTMIYDEGFNIEFNYLNFFAFSKYSIESKKVYKSQCYSTCVGWYHNKDKTKWGCYQAYKQGVEADKVTHMNSKNSLIILEPDKKSLNDEIISSMLSMQFKSVGDKFTQHNKLNRKMLKRFISSSSFLMEREFSMLKLDASFNNHALYISQINTLKKSWNAGLHPNFSNMSIRELNKFAGIPNNKHKVIQHKPTEDVSMFPDNFDWKNKLKPAGSQGNCGSCYVYSTIRMIEARLKIKYNHDVNLSVQHALDCSFYNQGCNGGYPFLVMKFANEFELIPEECKPYTETDGRCDNNLCEMKNLPYIYKSVDYKYIGGFYGACSQKKMMEELKNGPVVVSFEPDYNFMMYKSGVYHAMSEDTWIDKGLPKPEWQKVDHSVLLVGWGQENSTGEKFWIIQNTWGPSWGEDGFFRIRRGTDEYGIESICEVANPVVIDNKTGLEITNQSEIKSNNVIVNPDDHSDSSIFDIFK